MGTTTSAREPSELVVFDESAGDPGDVQDTERTEPDPPRAFGGRLLGAVLSGAGVAVLVGAIVFLRHDGPGAAVVQPTVRPAVTAAAAPASASPPAPIPARPASAAPGADATPSGTPALTTLTVLNNSRITGLASQTADVLRDRGWAVATIGNYTGRVPVTTVFYPAGEEAVARALGSALPAVQQVLPRFDGLPGDGLSLVVTQDFPAAG